MSQERKIDAIYWGRVRLQFSALVRALWNVIAVLVVLTLQALNLIFSYRAYRGLEVFRLNAQVIPTAVEGVLLLVTLLATLSPLWMARCLVNHAGSRLTRTLVKTVAALLLSLYYVVNILLLVHRSARGFPFDFYLFWYNWRDAISTLQALSDDFHIIATSLLLVIFANYQGLMIVLSVPFTASPVRSFWTSRVVASVCVIATQTLVGSDVLSGFRPLLATKSQAEHLYNKYYYQSIDLNKNNHLEIVSASARANESLFVVHLESLNAKLVTPETTPSLLRISKGRGVLLPSIQSASMLTIRGQEAILCSTLPTLVWNLASSSALSNGLVCLPRILKHLGYRTMFFHSFADLNSANTDLFMKWIGFDERHSTDIMKPGDKLLRWGWAEDVFFRRISEYLEGFRNDKLFVYIAVHSTNHYPFYNDEKTLAYPEQVARIPYRSPKTLKERLANSTFLQDHFFGEMYDGWFDRVFAEHSHMLVIGDHSWPIGIHAGNESNDHGAFQENFVTSMAFIPARRTANRSFRVGSRVSALYSQLDVLPTILNIYGINGLHYFGRSFLSDLIKPNNQISSSRCLVSVQPFSGKQIVTIRYPIKLIYDLGRNTIARYDLEHDPDELLPAAQSLIDEEGLQMLDDCLRSGLNTSHR
jgi:hypothetical protein